MPPALQPLGGAIEDTLRPSPQIQPLICHGDLHETNPNRMLKKGRQQDGWRASGSVAQPAVSVPMVEFLEYGLHVSQIRTVQIFPVAPNNTTANFEGLCIT
jgi:hypothetical protein